MFSMSSGKYLATDAPYASCLPCETGKATNKYGSASCESCKAGTFAPTKGATFCVAATKIINVYPNTNSKYKLNIEWSIPLHKTLSLNEMYVVIEPIDSITKQRDTNAIVIVQANLNKTTTGMLSFKIVDRVYQIHLRVQDKTNTTIGGIAKFSTPWQTTSSCKNNNLYLNTNNIDITKWTCKTCPKVGASCEGPITWSGVKAKFGYWQYNDHNKFVDDKFYPCLRPQSCLGAPNDIFASQFPKLANNQSAVAKCANHFKGRLCATCGKGFARNSKRGSCERCKEPDNILWFIAAIVFGLFGTCILVKITVFKARQAKFSDGVKKIVLSYLQLASLAAHANVPWTSTFQELFALQTISTSIGDAFLSIDCIFYSMTSWNVFVIKLVGILFVPVLVIPFAYCGICFCRSRFQSDHGTFKDQFVASLVLLWYLTFPSIIQKLFALITCTIPINGVRYVEVDPQIPCFVDEHRTMLLSAGLIGLLVYIIGMPMISLYVLKHVDRSKGRNKLRFGMLYDGFSEQYWYWEIVVLMRKIAIIVIAGFMEGEEQILAMLLVLFLVIYVTAICQPFENVQLLHLELASLAICFITFWTGNLFLVESATCHDGTYVGCKLAAVFVIGMNVIACLYLAGLYLYSKLKEEKVLASKIYNSRLVKCVRLYCGRGYDCFCKVKDDRTQRRRSSLQLSSRLAQNERLGGNIDNLESDLFDDETGNDLNRDGDEYHQL